MIVCEMAMVFVSELCLCVGVCQSGLVGQDVCMCLTVCMHVWVYVCACVQVCMHV